MDRPDMDSVLNRREVCNLSLTGPRFELWYGHLRPPA